MKESCTIAGIPLMNQNRSIADLGNQNLEPIYYRSKNPESRIQNLKPRNQIWESNLWTQNWTINKFSCVKLDNKCSRYWKNIMTGLHLKKLRKISIFILALKFFNLTSTSNIYQKKFLYVELDAKRSRLRNQNPEPIYYRLQNPEPTTNFYAFSWTSIKVTPLRIYTCRISRRIFMLNASTWISWLYKQICLGKPLRVKLDAKRSRWQPKWHHPDYTWRTLWKISMLSVGTRIS